MRNNVAAGGAVRNAAKPVLSSHLRKRPKFGFQDRLSLNAGQKYCRMSKHSALFLTFIQLPFVVLTGHFRHVLLCYFSNCTIRRLQSTMSNLVFNNAVHL